MENTGSKRSTVIKIQIFEVFSKIGLWMLNIKCLYGTPEDRSSTGNWFCQSRVQGRESQTDTDFTNHTQVADRCRLYKAFSKSNLKHNHSSNIKQCSIITKLDLLWRNQGLEPNFEEYQYLRGKQRKKNLRNDPRKVLLTPWIHTFLFHFFHSPRLPMTLNFPFLSGISTKTRSCCFTSYITTWNSSLS